MAKGKAVKDKNVLQDFTQSGQSPFFNKWAGAKTVIGTFTEEKDVKDRLNGGTKKAYTVLQDNGESITFDESIKPLGVLWQNVKNGQRVKIVFEGMLNPKDKKLYPEPIPDESKRVKIFGKGKKGKARAWLQFSCIQILKG